MIRYYLRHQSHYTYQQSVVTSFHRLFLSPDSICGQRCLSHDIIIQGAQGSLRFDRDFFTNRWAMLEVLQSYQELDICAWSVVEVDRLAEQISGPAWDEIHKHPFAIDQWRYDSDHCQAQENCADYARVSFTPQRGAVEALLELCQRVFQEFTYDPNASSISTTPQETLRQRRGVCQDFAHFVVTCLRSIGLPAAYVSGYLETQPPPGASRMVGADASHAWVALWVPHHGWVHADPTNGCLVGQRHVITAMGRDFTDVSPVSGIMYGGGQQTLTVGVDVIPESEFAEHPLCEQWPSHCKPG